MRSNENITANSIKVIQPELLVNCRDKDLGISESSLPESYDAADATSEGLTAEITEKSIIPNLINIPICDESDADYEGLSDDTMDIQTADERSESTGKSQADKALNLCEDLELFHDASNNAYCKLDSSDKNIIHKIASDEFILRIRGLFYKEFSKAMNINSIKEVIATLESKAIFDGKCREVACRVTTTNDTIYIDLCNRQNEFIAIDQEGYDIVTNPPVNFIRKKGMTPLPKPQPGGSLEMLKKHLGCSLDDKSFMLLIAWLLGALRGRAPYAILMLIGEQGSGKSTLTKMIRMLVDPSDAPLSLIGDETQSLAISANSSHMICTDNVSKITQGMSDLMCMISTAGNFKKRKLFTDADESIIRLANPQLINGISCVPQYPDLLERSLLIEMQPIESEHRRTDAALMAEFEADYPKMLGFLYEILSCILKNLPNVSLPSKPRMADFCEFVSAAEPKLGWEIGSIFKAMEDNQDELGNLSIDDNSFIQGVILFIEHQTNHKWIGSISELLRDLDKHFGKDNTYTNASDWPRSPQTAGKLLGRFTPVLKRNGYTVKRERVKDSTRKRFVEIYKTTI